MTAPSFVQAAWQPPQQFEEYRLVKLLGRGAMGQVFLAQDMLLDRPVAVKFIASFEPTAAAREQFFTEARAIARLQHPNVVAIYRVGEVHRRPYLVSEFVRGQALDKVEKPLTWQRVLEIGIGLARGLAAAHRRGVLHRDIKPANAILTEDGEAKLLDFGVAKLLDRPSFERTQESGAEARGALTALGAENGDQTSSRPRQPSIRPPSAEPSGASPASTAAGRAVGSPLYAVGSPLYMAPELWRGELSSRRADVYSLGVLLYELCAGHTPHRGVPLSDLPRVAQEVEAAPLAQAVQNIDPEFAAIVDKCLVRDPLARFYSGEALRAELEHCAAPARATTVPEGNPYRGLAAFEAEHRDLFFGRSLEARAILDRLRSEPFVLVAGDSGVGKSSLCRAGVLPAVAEGSLGEGGTWSIVRLVPGRRPLTALSAVLAPLAGTTEVGLATRLHHEPIELGRQLRKRSGEAGRVLIFVDQLEELLTLSDPEQASVVSAALGALVVHTPHVRLLAAARSDFLTRLTALPGLGDEISHALYLLRPVSVEGMREAINGPTRVKGFQFESEAMVDALVSSTGRASGGLPLLQFALAELWEARDQTRSTIPAAAMEALGGVEGALSRHADRVLAQLLPAERIAARRILIKLVTAEGTRARQSAAELGGMDTDAAERSALEALVRGRLVVVGEAEEGVAYEIAHEALLAGWGRLRAWLAGDAQSRPARQRLEHAATEWERLGRAREALWSSVQLTEIANVEPADFGPREAAFVAASRKAIARVHYRRRAIVAAVPLILAVAFVGTRAKTRHDLDLLIGRHLHEAEIARDAGRVKNVEVESVRREALELFDAKNWPGAEDAWSRAVSLAQEVDASYRRASGALESALSLDPARASVRARFGDVTYERILLAERDHQPAQHDELLERLKAHDEGGARLRRLHAPASVAIDTSPPGATVALERFESRGGRLIPSLPQNLGVTPIAERVLEQGSGVLVFQAPGRAPARLPLVFVRAERLRIAIDLPPLENVPAGFVYVPPGRSLFGSADDENVRRGFLNTTPLHEVQTGAYLISRTEVTFAEWILFLNALSPAERQRRTPAAKSPRNALELKPLPQGRWQLVLRATTHTYVAEAGDPVRYLARERRAVQDWLRFPVSAISYDDALAYAAWLDESGRVPGARLCDEYEWERAARGADGRTYPAGDRLEQDDANIDVTYGRQPLAFGPDEVGSHPSSRSPVGVDDMAGNVWEWTRSVAAPGQLVYRGGSWYHGKLTARSMNREVGEPTQRDPLIGVRICATRLPTGVGLDSWSPRVQFFERQ